MAEASPIRWEDPRFAPEIEKVRKSCNVTHTDDDAMIGMCASLCQRQDSCEQQANHPSSLSQAPRPVQLGSRQGEGAVR